MSKCSQFQSRITCMWFERHQTWAFMECILQSQEDAKYLNQCGLREHPETKTQDLNQTTSLFCSEASDGSIPLWKKAKGIPMACKAPVTCPIPIALCLISVSLSVSPCSPPGSLLDQGLGASTGPAFSPDACMNGSLSSSVPTQLWCLKWSPSMATLFTVIGIDYPSLT